MRVTVVGTGYVGLVTGTCLADMGNDVFCHDVNSNKIAKLQAGEMPIYEPGLEEMVRRNGREGRLRFTTDLAEALARCQIVFIAVGTPPNEDGGADRHHVLAAARAIAQTMQSSLTVVVKSTVPVGTCDMVEDLITEALAAEHSPHHVDVVSNPEFLKEGKAIEDFMRPDRIVVGSSSEAGDAAMRSLYSYFIRNGHTYLGMDVRAAEMTKYAANVMLATRISLMNELAQISDRLGVDIMQVRRGIGSDSRIGMSFLYPGIGFGGSCFPKDVKALSRMAVEADCPADILDAVSKVNRYQKVALANRVVSHFRGELKQRHFALWGLAFKPKTDDIREAPALAILRRLTDAGATICAYDPEAETNARAVLADNPKVRFAPNQYEALEGADALVLATEWAQFRKPDFERMRNLMKTPLIFDGRNQYEPQDMARLGFDYQCIGRPRR